MNTRIHDQMINVLILLNTGEPTRGRVQTTNQDTYNQAKGGIVMCRIISAWCV